MEEDTDTERTAIRKELSEMSFEDLIKLKERLGTKVYDEAMFGSTKKKTHTPDTFKRVNKNRPREMSSKIRAAPIQAVRPLKAPDTRDPRFDSLCGDFDEKVFRKAYKFVDGIRSSEKDELKEELKNEKDSNKKKDLKYLIQRMENQERDRQMRETKDQQQVQDHKERIESMKRGEKPHYPRKAEKKVHDLVTKFEELKKSGKLQKHIEKHRKKSTHRDRKRLKIIG